MSSIRGRWILHLLLFTEDRAYGIWNIPISKRTWSLRTFFWRERRRRRFTVMKDNATLFGLSCMCFTLKFSLPMWLDRKESANVWKAGEGLLISLPKRSNANYECLQKNLSNAKHASIYIFHISKSLILRNCICKSWDHIHISIKRTKTSLLTSSLFNDQNNFA